MQCYKTFEEHIGSYFFRYGTFIAKHPITAILFSITVNCLLGINIIWMKYESNLEQEYTPTNSRASQDRKIVQSLFPDSTATNFYAQSLTDTGLYGEVLVKSSIGFNILNTTYHSDLDYLNEFIFNIAVPTDDKKTLTYADLCAKRDNDCVTDGIVSLSDYFRMNFQNGTLTYPYLNTPQAKNISLNGIFGNITEVDGVLVSATFIKLRYNLRQDTKFETLSKLWEEQFVDKLSSFNNEHLELAFAHSDSLNQELGANAGGDAGYFKWTFTLMIVYVSFATAGGNFVSNPAHVGRAAVIAAGLAILGAFGMVSAAGISFVNIVGVMPFLILGIGIDNVFILLSNLADIPYGLPPEERVALTLKACGVSITITTVTDVIAFAAGYLSVFLSVRHFCIYTGVAVLLCYFNLMTFVLGCMILNEKRIADQRHCVTCLKVPTFEEINSQGKSRLQVIFCSGESPSTREDIESICMKVPNLTLPKIVLYTPCKIAIVISFLIYLGFAVWGTLQLQQGLVLQNLVSEDSYYFKYSKWQTEYFPTRLPISFVLQSVNNYSDIKTVHAIQKLLQTARRDSYINNFWQINWLSEYQKSEYFNDSSEIQFVANLKNMFLPMHPLYQNDVAFTETQQKIKASRIYVRTIDMKDALSEGNMMLRMRDIAQKSGLNAFSYSPGFLYFEQYIAVVPNTFQTVGIAIAAIFVVTFILIPNLVIILLVTLTMAMIMGGVFGFMHFWGLSLSSITMIHVIMSVGFSVDFSVHICHAFMSAEGTDRNARVYCAMLKSGGAIFNAALSSILGISLLNISKSYVFRSFFKVMLLVILFGVAHSVLLLPVVLSWIGPQKALPKSKIHIKSVENSL